MTSPVILTTFNIKIDGATLANDLLDNLQEIEVDRSLYLPSMATLTFMLAFDELDLAAHSSLVPGKALDVLLPKAADNTLAAVFKGEITSVEPVFSGGADPSQVIVRAYDKAHRLNQLRQTKTFLDFTHSDIISQLGQTAGLRVDVDATSGVHKYILQENQTHWEFIQRLARRNGMVAFVDDTGKLICKKPAGIASSPCATLEYGVQLVEFRPRFTIASQYHSAEVRDWSLKDKQAVVGLANAPESRPHPGNLDGNQAAGAAGIGSVRLSISDLPVDDATQAEASAKAFLSEARGGDTQAEGSAFGNAVLKPGHPVSITSIPAKFAGQYLLTRVRHVFGGPDSPYMTHFECTTGSAATAAAMIAEGAGQTHGWSTGSRPAAAIGIVTNIKDTNNDQTFGSVKVKFPWMPQDSGQEIESNWFRLVAPGGGANRGIMFMPEINDEVVVLFDRGNPDRGFVLGGLWNGQDAPPIANAALAESDGKIKTREIRSRLGTVVRITDGAAGDSKLEILLLNKDENSIVIEESTKKITIKAKTDIHVESDKVTVKGKEIMLDAETKVTVKSGNEILVDGANSTTIKGMNVKVEGTNVELKATGSLKAEGASVQIKGTGMVQVEAGGILSLKGSLVKLN